MYLLAGLIFLIFELIKFFCFDTQSSSRKELNYIYPYTCPWYINYGKCIQENGSQYKVIEWKRDLKTGNINYYFVLDDGNKKLFKTKAYCQLYTLDDSIEKECIKKLGNSLYGVTIDAVYDHQHHYGLSYDSRSGREDFYTQCARKKIEYRLLYDRKTNRPYQLRILDNVTKKEQWNLTLDEFVNGCYGFYKVVLTDEGTDMTPDHSRCDELKSKPIYERLTFAEFVKWGAFDYTVFRTSDQYKFSVYFNPDCKFSKDNFGRGDRQLKENRVEKSFFDKKLLKDYITLKNKHFTIDDKRFYNDLVKQGYKEYKPICN